MAGEKATQGCGFRQNLTQARFYWELWHMHYTTEKKVLDSYGLHQSVMATGGLWEGVGIISQASPYKVVPISKDKSPEKSASVKHQQPTLLQLRHACVNQTCKSDLGTCQLHLLWKYFTVQFNNNYWAFNIFKKQSQMMQTLINNILLLVSRSSQYNK